jgi:hypothetical protein
MLVSEFILLLEIQTNCKKWVWKKKSVEFSMCLHLGQWHMLYTSVHEKTSVNMSLHVH